MEMEAEAQTRKRFTFEFFPGRTLHLFFFTEVTNSDEILGQIRAGTLEMAFMSPSLVRCHLLFIII